VPKEDGCYGVSMWGVDKSWSTGGDSGRASGDGSIIPMAAGAKGGVMAVVER
jgi:hypothetical protein